MVWKQAQEGRAVTLGALRRLWRDGVESGEACGCMDAADIKRQGRERLAAPRSRRP